MKKHIFVVGLEPFNLALLQGLPNAAQYEFHELLSYKEVVRPASASIDLPHLLATAEERLSEYDDCVDAIIGYWDFPTSVIVPVLKRQHGLPGPSLAAVAACEHKFWSRLAQEEVLPDLVPRFCAIDPFDTDPLGKVDIDFPFWLKPVKSHSSFLGFKINSADDFYAHLPEIRAGIGLFGEPFNVFLDMVRLPDAASGVDGYHCIIEEIISAGRQCTLEGYVFDGEAVVYGVIDSKRSGRHRSSFARYQYPSDIPARVQQRMIDATKKFLTHIQYDMAPFNIEFYWDPKSDKIRLLEVNTRISKSHCPLFEMVDGVSHQQVAIDLGLGHEPHFPHRQGEFRIAAKFMVRMFEDGIVCAVPETQEVDELKRRFPESRVRVLTQPGTRLAHLPYQDSYSFELAEIFLGADSQTELLQKYATALECLPFNIESIGKEPV